MVEKICKDVPRKVQPGPHSAFKNSPAYSDYAAANFWTKEQGGAFSSQTKIYQYASKCIKMREMSEMSDRFWACVPCYTHGMKVPSS